MISKTNTLVDDYIWFFPFDPAFVQLPDNATDEQKTEHWRSWDRARETGDYSGLLIVGMKPTEFVVSHVSGMRKRRMLEALDGQGAQLQTANIVRFALKKVLNPDYKPKTVSEYGIFLAEDAVIGWLDEQDERIVPLLATEVLRRTGLLGKS